MAKQTINLGSAPNDRGGDKLRDAFDKINDNFTEVYEDIDSLGESLEGVLASQISLGDSRLYITDSEAASDVLITDSTGEARFLIRVGDDGVILIDAVDGPIRVSANDEQEWFFGADGTLSIPNGQKVVYRRWDSETPVGEASPGDSCIQAGMGFHISSGEGVALDAVNMDDPENPVYHSMYVSPTGNVFTPGGEITSVSALEPGPPSVGAASAISVTNGPNVNWTNGTGVLSNGINFIIAVADGVATVPTINDGGTGHWPGETFGPVPGTAFGGASPDDDMYFIVDSIVENSFTTIDLTKSVHAIDTDGYYVLPDGSDGQIIYLIITPGRNPTQFCIKVEHGRIGGNTYTDIWYSPFYGANSGVITLIWWDGGWSASDGTWD